MTNADLAANTLASGAVRGPDAGTAGEAARALTLLRACNEAMMEAAAEAQLLDEFCRLIVEQGGYRMAWVGMTETGTAQRVRPVAHFGHDEACLAGIDRDDAERECDISWAAVRSGRRQVNQDFAASSMLAPWMAVAHERGCKSCISLPLREATATFGVLSVCSSAPGAFSAAEASLLEEISRSLAYGIKHLRRQALAECAPDTTPRLLHILDNLFAYVALLDCNGVIQEINLASLDRAQLRREQAVGQRVFDMQPWAYDDKVRSQLIAAIEAGRQGRTLRYEVSVKISDDLVPIDFQISPIRNEQGKISGLLATAVDISRRWQADDARRESETQFRILFESANDCLLLLSLDGRILDINRSGARRLGYSKEEMVGRFISEFDAPEFAARVPQRMAQVMRDGHATFESAHVRRDGSHMPVEVNSIVVDKNGSRTLFSIIRDITERKLAEQAVAEAMSQMQKKEMAKTRFLAAAGHDLRQPLMAATLYIDTLKRTKLAPAQRQIVERLTHAMGTFKALLDALLNISRFDAGAVRPEYSLINVPELLIWLEDNFASVARNSGIACRLYFPMKEPLAVHSDAGLLKSILMNLVSNAIKFTPKGAVLLSARRRGGEVLFQVWDTGIGVPPEHQKHIFDEFYQVNNAQRDRAGGLGLGLAIAQRALALLGGRIECRSTVGRGSVFSFRLPAANAAADAGVRQDTVHALPDCVAATGKRFVVLEDDTLVAQAICNALTMMGGEVRRFHDADDALRHAARDGADHYIVDYTLGDSHNGVDFLTRVCRQAGGRVSAVLVTGDTSPDFVRSMADCRWPVLHKPVNMSELLACLAAQAA